MIGIIILETLLVIVVLAYHVHTAGQRGQQQKIAALTLLDRMKNDKASKSKELVSFLQNKLHLSAQTTEQSVQSLLVKESMLLQSIVHLPAINEKQALQIYGKLQDLLESYYNAGQVEGKKTQRTQDKPTNSPAKPQQQIVEQHNDNMPTQSSAHADANMQPQPTAVNKEQSASSTVVNEEQSASSTAVNKEQSASSTVVNEEQASVATKTGEADLMPGELTEEMTNELARCQAKFMSYLEKKKLITIEIKKQIHTVEDNKK